MLRGVRPTAGHVSLAQLKVMSAHRELPHGGARRACRALHNGNCAYTTIAYNQLPQSALPQMSGRRSARVDGSSARLSSLPGAAYFHVVVSHCRLGDWRHRLPEQGGHLLNLLFKVAAETMRTTRG